MIPAGCEFSYSLFCCILKTGPEPMYWTGSIHSFSRLKFQLTVVAIFQIGLETSSNLAGSHRLQKVKSAFEFKAVPWKRKIIFFFIQQRTNYSSYNLWTPSFFCAPSSSNLVNTFSTIKQAKKSDALCLLNLCYMNLI